MNALEKDGVVHKPTAGRKLNSFLSKLRGGFESKSFNHVVRGGAIYELSILVLSKKTCPDPAAVLAFEFYDADGRRVATSRGFNSSRSFDAYRQINCSTKHEPIKDLIEFEVPRNAVELRTILYAWHDPYIKLKEGPTLQLVKEVSSDTPLKDASPALEKRFEAAAGQDVELNYSFIATDEPARKYALMRFLFMSAEGKELNVCPPNLARSKIGIYRYIDCQPNTGFNDVSGSILFKVPEGVAHCEVSLMPWKGAIESATLNISLSEMAQPEPEPESEPKDTTQASVEFSASSVFGLNIKIQTVRTLKPKGAVFTAKFFNHDGEEISYTPPGFFQSSSVGTYYYVPVAEDHDEPLFKFTCFIVPPNHAKTCEVAILRWGQTTKITKVDIDSTDVEFADYIAREDLGSLSHELLKNLLLVSTSLGDTNASLRLSQEMLARKQTPQNAFRIRYLKGRLRELNTSWLPRISKTIKPSRKKPTPGSVMHLFKTIYPMESSGGSVRNWSIARLQASSNRDVVAAVLQMSSDDIAASSDIDVKTDGFREVVASGFKTVYYSYFGLKTNAAPSDTLLEFSTTHLAKIMAKENSHIVHAASGFRGYDSALQGLALAKHFHRPFVYEVRSFHEHTWGPLMPHTFASPLTSMRIAQENRCMMEADSVITISKALKAQLIKRGVPSKRIFVVPNSINDSFLEKQDKAGTAAIRKSLGLADKTVVGYISNLSRREGVEILLQGFKAFHTLRPQSVCLIVGDGIERDNLTALSRELGIEDHVIFTGFVDHNLIKDYYATIDLFVVPRVADYASDFVTPMKPFEAMALKRPILMSDRPVSFEIVGDKETRGLLFETGNPRSLCEKLIVMQDDSEGTQRRIKNAYSWIKKSRTWASQMATYDAAYSFAEQAFNDKQGSVPGTRTTKSSNAQKPKRENPKIKPQATKVVTAKKTEPRRAKPNRPTDQLKTVSANEGVVSSLHKSRATKKTAKRSGVKMTDQKNGAEASKPASPKKANTKTSSSRKTSGVRKSKGQIHAAKPKTKRKSSEIKPTSRKTASTSKKA